MTRALPVKGTVQRIGTSTRNGYTVFYVLLEDNPTVYSFSRESYDADMQLALTSVGDSVSFTWDPKTPTQTYGDFDNLSIPAQ